MSAARSPVPVYVIVLAVLCVGVLGYGFWLDGTSGRCQTLHTGTPAQQSRAAQELARRGRSAVPCLVRELNEPRSTAKLAAAQALLTLGEIQVLSEAAASPDPDLRRVVFADLLGAGPRYPSQLIPVFVGGLTDPDSSIRQNSLIGLQNVGPLAASALPQMRLLLLDGDEQVRSAAVRTMVRIGGVEELRDLMNTHTTAAWSASIAALRYDLGHLAPQVVPQLEDALEYGSLDVKRGAAELLGRAGRDARGASGLLVDALQNSDPVVRRQAASALKQVGGLSEAREMLKSSDGDVRREGAELMEKQGRSSIPELIPLLLDRSPEVVMFAMGALRSFGSEAQAAIPTLTDPRILHNPDTHIRVSAVRALEAIGPEALPALKLYTLDAMPEVRYAAQSATNRLKWKTLPPGSNQ